MGGAIFAEDRRRGQESRGRVGELPRPEDPRAAREYKHICTYLIRYAYIYIHNLIYIYYYIYIYILFILLYVI